MQNFTTLASRLPNYCRSLRDCLNIQPFNHHAPLQPLHYPIFATCCTTPNLRSLNYFNVLYLPSLNIAQLLQLYVSSQPVTAQLLYIILYHSNLQIFSNYCNYSVPLQPLNCPVNAKFCATEAVRLPNYYNTCTTPALRLLNYYNISCTTLAFRLLM